MTATPAPGKTAAIRGTSRVIDLGGGNIALIGSTDYVVDKPIGLKKARIDGIQLGFYDFAPDLGYFVETTLPLIKEAGLRL